MRIKIGENSLNEKNIQEVLEIEKQADAIHEAALHEAQQIPVQAEQEAQALIENARAAAEEEARKIVANAQSAEETARILSEAEDQIKRTDGLAKKNCDRAVNLRDGQGHWARMVMANSVAGYAATNSRVRVMYSTLLSEPESGPVVRGPRSGQPGGHRSNQPLTAPTWTASKIRISMPAG